ncbi:MAG: adenine phosphoribosyltransferase [Ichthyobacteriaceae bacterium]|nr:adenine phosphoribosyltransferase [Ichthyobacteriaceae bacterium]
MDLTKYIRDVKDFPKKGIDFKDITPLLLDSSATAEAVKQFEFLVEGKSIDKVVAMEARGFFFGTLIAQKLGAGFVPVRKPGKLPFSTLNQQYSLEYGTDELQIHTDAINPGDNVLIHDDVLATGGTAEAVVKLVELAGGKVVQLDFLLDLTFLNGKDKLKGYNINSLIKY